MQIRGFGRPRCDAFDVLEHQHRPLFHFPPPQQSWRGKPIRQSLSDLGLSPVGIGGGRVRPRARRLDEEPLAGVSTEYRGHARCESTGHAVDLGEPRVQTGFQRRPD